MAMSDLQEFGVQIERFGLEASDVPEYSHLLQVIESASQSNES